MGVREKNACHRAAGVVLKNGERELRERLAENPSDPAALLRLARLVGSARGRKDEAVDLWRRYVQLADTSRRAEALLALGRAQIEARRDAEAITTLQRCSEENPENVEAWDLLGELLRRAGRLDAAVRALGHVVKLDPQAIRARAAMVFCLDALGRRLEAQQVLGDLQRLGGADPAVAALVRELVQRRG
ncbi:MAG: tetratricopeptide repeat protein [Gemmatimonadota bacterium]|nr:MAG: tetratricopeptide repeat protein [Gemmatimonadota bacterium]